MSYYFTPRDAYRTESIYRTDLQLYYSHRIVGGLEIFVIPQVFNVFNAQHVVSVNQTVNTNFNTSNLLAFNPFTNASPVECPQGTALATCKAMGANWQKGSLFGTPTQRRQLPDTALLPDVGGHPLLAFPPSFLSTGPGAAGALFFARALDSPRALPDASPQRAASSPRVRRPRRGRRLRAGPDRRPASSRRRRSS